MHRRDAEGAEELWIFPVVLLECSAVRFFGGDEIPLIAKNAMSGALRDEWGTQRGFVQLIFTRWVLIGLEVLAHGSGRIPSND